MSFGRRLALFFVLIVLVPMLALVGVLVIVSEDSRTGKADASLAAGLETALGLYREDELAARPAAEELAGDPLLGAALRSGDGAALRRFAAGAAREPGVEAIEVLGPAGTIEAAAGSADAIAFARLDLADGGARRGALRVSVTSAQAYAAELKRLTNRDLVVEAGGGAAVATAEVPELDLEAGQTRDVELPGGKDARAHLLTLDDAAGEAVLMLGPAPEGGFLSIGRAGVVLLVVFLLAAVIAAYLLARTLTGLHSRVAEQAITDPLTGLWNRRRMNQLLDREAERALRFGHELSVLLVDVDDFKGINDAHGHTVGDRVLEAVAEVVRRTTRSIDVAARYGGDELALMLMETDAVGAAILGERLAQNVRHERIAGEDGRDLAVTISVGAATLPDCAGDPESLVDAADQALLLAKRSGKNQLRSAPGRSPAESNGHGGPRPASRARGAGRRRAG